MKAISLDIAVQATEIFALKVRLAQTHDLVQTIIQELLTVRTRLA